MFQTEAVRRTLEVSFQWISLVTWWPPHSGRFHCAEPFSLGRNPQPPTSACSSEDSWTKRGKGAGRWEGTRLSFHTSHILHLKCPRPEHLCLIHAEHKPAVFWEERGGPRRPGALDEDQTPLETVFPISHLQLNYLWLYSISDASESRAFKGFHEIT